MTAWIDRSEAIDALAAAWVKASGEMHDLVKTQTANAGQYGYSYATLADVFQMARPIMAKHSLLITQTAATIGDEVAISTTVLHASGQFVTAHPLTLPVGKTAQATGSAVSYGKRYALMAMLGDPTVAPALLDHQLTVPDEATANQAAEAVDILERFLRRHPNLPGVAVSLNADDSDTALQIPGHALRLLVDILAQIANGNAVTVAPVHAELTTQQAADILNVSRPYLVKLLEERKLPYRRVGNRRRVLLADLLAYKRIDDADRRAIADELTSEAQRLGLDY